MIFSIGAMLYLAHSNISVTARYNRARKQTMTAVGIFFHPLLVLAGRSSVFVLDVNGNMIQTQSTDHAITDITVLQDDAMVIVACEWYLRLYCIHKFSGIEHRQEYFCYPGDHPGSCFFLSTTQTYDKHETAPYTLVKL